MLDNSEQTHQIAKNTVILYVRMICTMLITLYSSRVVLQALGVEDFGLFNVVGGVVALLSFLRTSLTSSTQRFISFELGRNDSVQLKRVFNMSLITHMLISLIIVILSETVGLWFLNTHINIPVGREVAANWIFQFSIISLCVSTITVPYNADVISHEKMSFYALVSILEAIVKLLLAYLLFLSQYDRLIVYGGLMMLVNFIDLCLYYFYCRKNFVETKFMWFVDKQLFTKIFSFSGWTIVGQLAVVGANQGTTILINMFHSIVANAAMGIAQQVNNAISGLTANFQTAFQPQLTKSYAAKDYDYMNNLISKTSKISYFLLFLASLPIVINIDWILSVWLGDNVPLYTNQFCVLYLLASLFNALSAPLWISVYATGRIKNYQIAVSAIFFSDIIIVYLIFHFYDTSPVVAMLVKAVINMIIVFVRIVFSSMEVPGFSAKNYLKKTISPILVVSGISIGMVLIIYFLQMGTYAKLIISIPIFLISCLLSFKIGLTNLEQMYVIEYIKNILRKLCK